MTNDDNDEYDSDYVDVFPDLPLEKTDIDICAPWYTVYCALRDAEEKGTCYAHMSIGINRHSETFGINIWGCGWGLGEPGDPDYHGASHIRVGKPEAQAIIKALQLVVEEMDEKGGEA